MRRLHRWTEISGWPVGAALGAGEVRARCASPWCGHAAALRAGSVDPQMQLWVLARRMRCRGCGHRGAEFEVWRAAQA